MTGAELIAVERVQQVTREGYTTSHDDDHNACELTQAAVAYAIMVVGQVNVGCKEGDPMYDDAYGWPWDMESWKPSTDPIRNLVKAGALIAAEIDRLQRRVETDG